MRMQSVLASYSGTVRLCEGVICSQLATLGVVAQVAGRVEYYTYGTVALDHNNLRSLADEPTTTRPNLAALLLCVVPARPHGLWPPYAVLPVVSGHQALLWQESIKLARTHGYGITPNVITATV